MAQTELRTTLLVIALCVLPALVSAVRPVKASYEVIGRVYCDTCRAGFETSATSYIQGANVRIECKHKDTMQVLYSKDGTTDWTGTYKILVTEDHGDQLCDALLISSPERNCATVSPGRERARVILTSANGITSVTRYANAMGFMQDEMMSGCAQVMKQYQLDGEDN